MRERDRDLILAYVAGELSDPSDALALIAGSEEARTEYEAQVAVRESLASLDSMQMSDVERAALRRDTWSQLRAEATQPAKAPWYYRWVPVAAAGILAVGVAGVLIQDGADDASTAAFEEVASNLAGDGDSSITTQANADSAVTEAAGGEAGGDDAAGSEEAESALAPAMYAGLIDELRRDLADDAALSRFFTSGNQDLIACLERAGVTDHVVIELFEPPLVPDEGPVIVAAPDGENPAEAPLTLVSLDACEIVTVDMPSDE